MIPFHEEFVKNINKKEKVIQVKIPEELIKINN